MILFSVLLGIISMSLALYTYFFVADAARQATRYAIVRGSTSCTYSSSLSNCNATSDQIQTYVRGIAYPGITSSKLHITAKWLTPSSGKPTTWSACTTGTCNAPGNLVKVVATYAYPVSIPFVPTLSINLRSTAQMVIAQ